MTTQPSSQAATSWPNHRPYLIAGTTGTILLLIIGFLALDNFNKTKYLEHAYLEINAAHSMQAELENQYHAALTELENLKGSNQEMTDLIEAQKVELEARKARIASLLTDRSKLQQARQEIGVFQVQTAQFIAEMEQLKNQNSELTATNARLISDKQQLFSNLQTQIMENAQLNEAKAVLVSQNTELARSVQIGSVVQVGDVRVEGLKVRARGKLSGKKSAKRVDMLKVCFTALPNEIVQPGVEQFFVRIVNPIGETLAIESLGSGRIVHEKTGEEVRYTQVAETNYHNDSQNLCLMWNPDIAFQSGTYQVEVYNKGYLSGTGSFELR